MNAVVSLSFFGLYLLLFLFFVVVLSAGTGLHLMFGFPLLFVMFILGGVLSTLAFSNEHSDKMTIIIAIIANICTVFSFLALFSMIG